MHTQNRKPYKNYLRSAMWVTGATVGLPLLHSCASIGNPSGGPRDEDPPRVVRTSPAQGSTGMTGRHVEITFDELVNIKDAFTNVVVSPPSASTPKVLASGRNVIVTWDDPLAPSTTYTVDFGASIEDINEGNPLGNYSFSFSTGSEIDTLRISGIVLDASTLEPQQGMLVGVHSAESPDSALRTLRFERATKTDDRGRFTIRGLKAIPYNLFALGDLNNDYRWDNPAELIGFYPTPITPYSETGTASDTIYDLKTGAMDSVVSRQRTIFLPNNIFLPVFDIGYKAQYLVNYERPDSAKIKFIFNAKADKLPDLKFININVGEDTYITEHSATNDTITYWFNDKRIAEKDSLRIALSYLRTDAKQTLTAATDTLLLVKPKVKQRSKPDKKNKKQLEADSIAAEKAKWLTVSPISSTMLDVYAPLTIEVPEPLVSIDEDMIHLEQQEDTIWTKVDMPGISGVSPGLVRRYKMKYPWKPGGKYRFTVDSTAMEGISGKYNATLQHEFSIKKPEDYASLTLRIIPDTIAGYVEVLSTSDSPVALQRVQNGAVTFPYLSPSDYYARFIATSDSIMQFHPGDYDRKIQPDDVYYYPKLLSLKRYDRSEQWDLNAIPVDMQKPEAIKKNKPKQNKATGRNRQEESATEDEDEDYFDVNRNPFDPKYNNTRKNKTR